MELSNIKLKTTWNDAATRINSNNQKIGQEIDKLKRATYKSKGYFPTYSQLMQFYPKASAGSIAYVGYTYPYVIWAWNDITESWENTGQYGGSETVSLENYYTKEETQKKIEEYHEVLTQAQYDALEVKEDKFYFIYEEE